MTICRIAVDFFWVVTPCCWTGGGRDGSAIATRFCTSTWAKSGSVPMSNVTISVYEPSLALVDCM